MEHYISLLEGLEISLASGRLNIEGRDYTLNQFRSNFFDIVEMSDPKAIELMLLEKKDRGQFRNITKELYDAVKHQLKPRIHHGLEEVEGLHNLTPVVDMADDEVYLIDEANSIVSEINYKAWCRAVGPAHRKAIETDGLPMAKFTFDPYDTTRIKKGVIDGNREIVFINKYTTPKWRNDIEEVEVPTIFNDFMNHLFKGNQVQIDYCLDWMAEAIVGRCQTYLVLNGDKGTGKNTLYEIMRALVGHRYSVTAPKSLASKEFNSALKDKRLILFDEFKIHRNEHMTLKRMINKGQTIERKGVDADTEIETFNSFMIFHNDVSDMYVERDDRRFSVLDITDKNLLTLWSVDKVTDLVEELEKPDSELVKHIGSWLLKRYETRDFNNHIPFKGDKFHEIVEYHMPLWLRVVVAMLENGEVKDGEISFKKDIEKRSEAEKTGNKKIQWRRSTLEKILKEYRYKDKWSIGEIGTSKGRGNGLRIIVNPDLLEYFGYEDPSEDLEVEDEEDFL